MGLFKRQATAVRLVAPRSGFGFLVSGTTHRQAELGSVGAGARLFQLVRVLDNPHDPSAVAVVCDGQRIGWIAAKNSGRYSDAVDRVGGDLWVHGVVSRDSAGWLASIDCPYPEDIG